MHRYNGAMPLRKDKLATNEIYHVCNRTVEGREIFVSPEDCVYFLETLFVGNTTATLPSNWRRDIFTPRLEKILKKGRPLVSFRALTLMSDHLHFLIEQLVDNGIPYLMQRTCDSFAKYINKKYDRKGSLFMGRYKAVPIVSQAQANHIITYVHGNILDMFDPKWREGKIENWPKAKVFMEKYPWSTLGLFGKTGNSHPLISKFINKKFGENCYSRPGDYFNEIRNWSMRAKSGIEEYLLE